MPQALYKNMKAKYEQGAEERIQEDQLTIDAEVTQIQSDAEKSDGRLHQFNTGNYSADRRQHFV